MTKKTQELKTFEMHYKQSSDLSGLIIAGANALAAEHLGHLDKLTRKVVGVSYQEYSGWTESKKQGIVMSPVHEIAMQALTEKVEYIFGDMPFLAEQVFPSILLTYLLTIFEAYIHDIIIKILDIRPKMLATFIEGKSENIQNNFRGKTKEEQIRYLFQICDLNTQIKELIYKCIGINISNVWGKDKAILQEIQRAKHIRNQYVHHSGIIDSVFRRQLNDMKLVIGAHYAIKYSYLDDLAKKMLRVAERIDNDVISSYPDIFDGKLVRD